MHNQLRTKPRTIRVLILLLFLLGLGGIGGGIPMLLDPSGASMGLPPGLLAELPIQDFVLPGMFLIIVMGVVPFILAYGLWGGARWAWLGTLVQGLVLVLWICFQILLWGEPIILQYIYIVWGIALLVLSWLPSTRNEFEE